MKNIYFVILFMMYGIVFVQANDLSKPFTIGVSGVGIFEGAGSDPLESDFPGLGLRADYHLTKNWSMIGEILYTNPDYETGGNTIKVDVVDYIGSVGYNFDKINYIIPFINSGLGYRTISDVNGRDDWNLLVGAGVEIPMENNSFSFIIEGKGRWNLENGNDQGMLSTVGINYSF